MNEESGSNLNHGFRLNDFGIFVGWTRICENKQALSCLGRNEQFPLHSVDDVEVMQIVIDTYA